MSKRSRRGQSEVIGGLIVLTLLFMFAIPIIMNTYYSMVKTGQQVKASLTQEKGSFNEKLSVGPVDPNSELARRAGWVPGVWINNTGTVAVTLDKLYLVDTYNNTIYKVYDLKNARPGTPIDITKMLIDVTSEGTSKGTPPSGQPITLQPGETLLIVFNTSLINVAPHLVVLVESSRGILHPIAGATGTQTLYPGRPGGAGGGAGAWRGIFTPQSGFSLIGYDQLAKYGTYYAWKPPIFVKVEPEALEFYHSFIYEDPDYPGMYMLDVQVYESKRGPDYYLLVVTPYKMKSVNLKDGYTIYVRGYVGTYDTGPGNNKATYISGYAFEVIIVNSHGSVKYQFGPYQPIILGSSQDYGIIESDFDGNGINELTFFSYLNGPTYSSSERINIDADGDGSRSKDALVWTYMAARDISGVDYVKVTVKLNYYWTDLMRGECPNWSYRHLKVFSIVVWKYDRDSGTWRIAQYQDFGYTSEKPVQFQKTATFPLDHDSTYRVGVMMYDNYRDWDGYGYHCYKDFTMSLEHMIVEYGVYNPLFQESPPLYIVAIPQADLIGDIGEKDYAKAYNISDLSTAKVLAQQSLLNKLESELGYAGVAGYTVVRDPTTLCKLLFSSDPPKYAVIIWLQGNKTLSEVTEGVCSVDYSTLRDKIRENHWVLVWPFGKPFGDITATYTFNHRVTINGPGNYTGNITEEGISVRKKAYAFYLLNSVPFEYEVVVGGDDLVKNTSFYKIDEDTYGTVGFWVYDSTYTIVKGAVVLNPVHVDWDASGDGALPETIAQQVVYSALIAWVETYQNT